VIILDKFKKIIKHYSVHVFGLALSLSAIFHTMTKMSNEPLFQWFFGIGGIFAGLAIQYCRGRAAAHRKRDLRNEKNQPIDKYKAYGFWAIVIICICIFDFLSAFGIAVTQIDKGEQQYSALVDQKTEIDKKIADLNKEIERQKRLQEQEFQATGNKIGRNYETFNNEIKSLESQKAQKQIDVDKIKAQMVTLDKSIFARISEKSGIPAFWIEFTMFAGLMFLIYFIPLLTPWKVKLDNDENDDEDANDNNDENTDSIEIITKKESTELHTASDDNKKELMTYVNAAIRDTGKLNGNHKVIELTGLPLDQCLKFRDWLMKLKIDGIPAIKIRQGGGDVNIPKHKILKAIEEL
jgi:hypothetical protein